MTRAIYFIAVVSITLFMLNLHLLGNLEQLKTFRISMITTAIATVPMLHLGATDQVNYQLGFV